MKDPTLEALRHDREALVKEIELAGGTVRGSSVFCPYHDDRNASGSIYKDEHGAWRYRCHGCGVGGDVYDIRKLRTGEGPTLAPKQPQAQRQTASGHVYASIDEAAAAKAGAVRGKVEATYIYANPATGNADMIVLRLRLPDGGKTFRQLHPVAGGVVAKAPGKPWPIYNRGRVAKADTVLVVEGEQCVHALHEVGIVATTSPDGAGKAHHADWTPLAGKRVWLWPDFDEKGINHMRAVAAILEKLDPAPAVFWIDPGALELPPAGDVVDYLARMGEATPEARRQAVEQVMRDAEPVGASGDLRRRIEGIITGRYALVDWPWSALARLTMALLPGTITLICGDPGDGKSLFLLQAAAYWHEVGVKIAVFELEEDRAYHLARALAQVEGDSRLTDPEYIARNPVDAREAFARSADWLDEFGRCIHEAPERQATLDELAGWVERQAKSRTRIIAVDPITAAATSEKSWVDDNKFLMRAKRPIVDGGASLVLVTHPRKGRKGLVGLDELAGGAAYARFAQTALWLERHQPPKETKIITPCGKAIVTANRTLRVLKCRNGRGHGLRLAYNLSGDTLRFSEEGIVEHE